MKTTKIATELIHKGFFQVTAESGYISEGKRNSG